MSTILLVKHGGPAKVATLQAAERLGDVVVVDTDPLVPYPVPCVRVAQLEPALILAALERERIQPSACLTFVDSAISVTSTIAARLALPGLDPGAASILRNKIAMRERLSACGIEQPRFAIATGDQDIESAVREVGTPCVLKPASGAYSLGVVRIDRVAEARERFATAAAELGRSEFSQLLRLEERRWLVEQYLNGPELSVELLGGAEPRALAIHEKLVNESGGHFREDRFVSAPWQLNDSTLSRTIGVAVDVAKALGFVIGVGSLEMRIVPHGVCPIELQACPIGGIVSRMVDRTQGIDLHTAHARAYLGLPLERHAIVAGSCAMDVLYADRPGHFTIHGVDHARGAPGVVALDILSEDGRVVEPYAEYLGFLCCCAKTSAGAVETLNAIRSTLRIEIRDA